MLILYQAKKEMAEKSENKIAEYITEKKNNRDASSFYSEGGCMYNKDTDHMFDV